MDLEKYRPMVREACERIVELESDLNRMDAVCGDGETGSNLASGARFLLEELDQTPTVKNLALRLNSAGCGTLGTLWSFLLMTVDRATTAEEALTILEKTFASRSEAKVGEKTMADSLLPWIETMKNGQDFEAALLASKEGMLATESQAGVHGRGKYARERSVGTLDPGAFITHEILAVLTKHLGVTK